MKPRPTKIQPGATHWSAHPITADWYKKQEGAWLFYDEGYGWWVKCHANDEFIKALIPVEHLMAQPPEWNGEGLPPVGTEVDGKTVSGVWREGKVVGYDVDDMGEDVVVAWVAATESYHGFDEFRPIKSEREIAIEAISLAISRSTYLTKDLTNAIAAALYNEGYRKVEK
jgi:hypothetical protein